MKIYQQKRGWKIALFIIAVFIVTGSFLYINIFLQKLAREEKAKVEIWAKAISRKAHLVSYQEQLFKNLQEEQKEHVQIWAEATRRASMADFDDNNITFYLDIINNNKNIPVVVTDTNYKKKFFLNLPPEFDDVDTLTQEMIDHFTDYPPMEINWYADEVDYLFYANSNLYTELKTNLDDLVKSFLTEVVDNSLSNEIIIVDSMQSKVIAFGGDIDTAIILSESRLDSMLVEMSNDNKPLEVNISNYGRSFIYYKDSYFLFQMRYFPIILVIIIATFLLVTYILFSLSRKAEQNFVWAGMAKETAHQLGTPLSSLLGWIEMLKMQDEERGYGDSNSEALGEMEKDINRLKLVSERFSKIGSQPEMHEENLVEVIDGLMAYMRRRTSSKIEWVKTLDIESDELKVQINRHVFVWVLENLCKNSVDAIEGPGKIEIHLIQNNRDIFIDISDTGKGLPKGSFSNIFKPGFTTKSRGWGLGLSLAKRIIENYHKGRIFVKQSAVGEGTTIRIHLKG